MRFHLVLSAGANDHRRRFARSRKGAWGYVAGYPAAPTIQTPAPTQSGDLLGMNSPKHGPGAAPANVGGARSDQWSRQKVLNENPYTEPEQNVSNSMRNLNKQLQVTWIVFRASWLTFCAEAASLLKRVNTSTVRSNLTTAYPGVLLSGLRRSKKCVRRHGRPLRRSEAGRRRAGRLRGLRVRAGSACSARSASEG